MGISVHMPIFEPERAAVIIIQPGLAVSKSSLDAAAALGRVRAIEEGDVLVADVAEPVLNV